MDGVVCPFQQYLREQTNISLNDNIIDRSVKQERLDRWYITALQSIERLGCS